MFERVELLIVFDLVHELFNINEDVSFYIHESFVLHFELVVVFDMCWQPAIDEVEDCEEDMVFEEGTDLFVAVHLMVIVPSYDVPSCYIVEEHGSVLIVET